MNIDDDQRSELKIAYTINEAAHALSISRGHLYKLLSEGHLTRRKVGKRTLILRDELESFIRSCPSTKWRDRRSA